MIRCNVAIAGSCRPAVILRRVLLSMPARSANCSNAKPVLARAILIAAATASLAIPSEASTDRAPVTSGGSDARRAFPPSGVYRPCRTAYTPDFAALLATGRGRTFVALAWTAQWCTIAANVASALQLQKETSV
jgi:hypothetical protein